MVAAAFVFFNPDTVAEAWARGRKVASPADSARAFAACGHAWAEAHLPADLDAERLADLAGRVVAASSPAGAPLFAGWRTLPEPASPAALALHHLNALRELRGALHGAAVLAEGLTPLQALAVKTPFMAALFGWGEAPAPSDADAVAWQRAEQATDRAIAPGYAALGDRELEELVALAATAAG